MSIRKVLLGIICVLGLATFLNFQSTKADYQEKRLEMLSFVEETNTFEHNEIQCMALNLYHEARNESLAGQMAVNHVVLNRRDSDLFPNTVCDVVLESREYHRDGTPVKNRCQFSWYCDGMPDTVKNRKVYDEIVELSRNMYYNYNQMVDVTEGSLFYHAIYIKPPRWAQEKYKVVTIDNHIFYEKI